MQEIGNSEDLLDISPTWFSEYSDVDSSEDQNSWNNEQDQRSEIISYIGNLSKGRRSFFHGHNAIIERAYRFINDEIFSSETSTDSESENEEIMKFLCRKRKFPSSLKPRGYFRTDSELREIGKSFKKSLKKINWYSKYGFQNIISYDKEEKKISDDESITEAKLLGDIKRRIDEYFEHDFCQESSNLSEKSSSIFNSGIVKSTDSGVSADFLPWNKIPENGEKTDDLGFGDDIYYYPKDLRLPDEEELDDDNEEVEKAMRKLTEELIICERKAIDRGFIISAEKKNNARKKVFRSTFY